jgi:hypothetical protein
MEQSSEPLYRLNPVSYNAEIEPTGPLAFGLIAEDVEYIDPDLVTRDKNGNAFSVRYDQVNAMLLNEFLKEHKKVLSLETQLAQQQKEFGSKLSRQEKQIESLSAGLQKAENRPEGRPAPTLHARYMAMGVGRPAARSLCLTNSVRLVSFGKYEG